MFDIFKLLFTILLASYVYNNSKLCMYLNRYKPYIMQCVLSVAYNTIYYYSCFEMQITKLFTIIDPYVELLKEYIINNNKNIYIIEMFKDGLKINGIITDNDNVLDKELFLGNDFDLIVISDCTKPVPINKLCINNIPNNIADYEVSNARFISFKLIYGSGNVVDIELINNNHNFYVVNNVFDKSFFKYYIQNISKINIPDIFSYNIELIDNNINMHVLDDTYSITVYKDDYEITKIDKDVLQEEHQELKEEELKEEELKEEELKEEHQELKEEELKEEEERINSDEFVKLDNVHCIDF